MIGDDDHRRVDGRDESRERLREGPFRIADDRTALRVAGTRGSEDIQPIAVTGIVGEPTRRPRLPCSTFEPYTTRECLDAPATAAGAARPARVECEVTDLSRSPVRSPDDGPTDDDPGPDAGATVM